MIEAIASKTKATIKMVVKLLSTNNLVYSHLWGRESSKPNLLLTKLSVCLQICEIHGQMLFNRFIVDKNLYTFDYNIIIDDS